MSTTRHHRGSSHWARRGLAAVRGYPVVLLLPWWLQAIALGAPESIPPVVAEPSVREVRPEASEPSADPQPKPARIYSPWKIEDLDDLAKVLKSYVAEIDVKIARKEETLDEPTREGYGAVVGARQVVALSFLVQDALTVRVRGPTGHGLDAMIVVYDNERRVALLETRAPLDRLGLRPAILAPKASRFVDESVYALVSTMEHAGVLHGAITDLGEEPEYEGYPRVDLRLVRGMPIFDEQARLVGYARTVAWDLDPFMIVPAEKIFAEEVKAAGEQEGKAEAESEPKEQRQPKEAAEKEQKPSVRPRKKAELPGEEIPAPKSKRPD